jgi:hypothetical protein
MARVAARGSPQQVQLLTVLRQECPACSAPLHWRYENRRTVVTLGGMLGLRMRISRCENMSCERYHRPYRPEAEGALVLPQHEFGLDVVALVGALRHQEHRSVPEIHAMLLSRGVSICERSVTSLVDRYDELLAIALGDSARLRKELAAQGRVVLALDGLQPDVGHEVLWVLLEQPLQPGAARAQSALQHQRGSGATAARGAGATGQEDGGGGRHQ